MVPKVQIDGRTMNINWALIIQTGVILLGGAFGWARLEANQADLARELKSHMEENGKQFERYVLKDVQTTRNGFIDMRLSELSGNQAKMNEKLDAILFELKKK